MIGFTLGSTRVDLGEVARALEVAGFDIRWYHHDGFDCVGIVGPNSNAVAVYEDGIVVVEGPHYPSGIPFLTTADLATHGLIVKGMRQHAEEHSSCTGYTENADAIESFVPTWEQLLRVMMQRNNLTAKEVLERWHHATSTD